MSEAKDPTIKLFGKTIHLLPDDEDDDEEDFSLILTSPREQNKDTVQNDPKPSGGGSTGTDDKKNEPTGGDTRTPNVDKETSGISEDHKTSNPDNKECSSPETSTKEDSSGTKNSDDDKILKKPTKILPCPRCNSMDTKFCYYNNYNVNQPRHLCKNCHRYWTAGGTMRILPVGSGRRKSKGSLFSRYRHILVAEAVQAARADAANGIHHPNSTVLTFASASHPCESTTSGLILAAESQNRLGNKFQKHEQRVPVSNGSKDYKDDHSSGSSSTITDPVDKGLNVGPVSVKDNNSGSPHQVPCFPLPPWHWSPLPQPAFGSSGFPPTSFYPPPPYWGYTMPNPWNMQWLSPQSSSTDHSVLSSGPNSQTLGKHSRDGSIIRPSNTRKEDMIIEEKNPERGILIPKTLRINDPNEAAKSSIWSTLGIKNDNTTYSSNGANLLDAFHPKGKEKNHIGEASLVLQANPAALSRSHNFLEST